MGILLYATAFLRTKQSQWTHEAAARTSMGAPQGSGILAGHIPYPRALAKDGSGFPPQTAGVRDSGLWGRAHTPCKMTGMGQGKCSLPWAGRHRKAHPGVL